MEKYLYYDLNHPERCGPFLESWKPVNDFEENYQISDYGRVKSKKNGVLKLNRDKTGYIGMTLHALSKKRRISIHILVCEHFIPNTLNKPCVNHKWGDKHQNFVHELEWCTHQENMIHSFAVLGRKTNQQDWRKKKIYAIKDGIEQIFLGIRKASRELNIPQ